MAGGVYTASLRGGGPWGFRLQGGKDFGSPLAISKVTPGSKAAVAGVQSGDYIVEINGASSDNMTHFDAQDAVRRAGLNLDLLLDKKDHTKTVVVTETVHSAKSDHKFNAKAKPFGAVSSPAQISQPQAAVTGRTSPAGGSTWQPPSIQPQRASVAHSTPAGAPPPPAPPPVPPPAVSQSRGGYDHPDASKQRHVIDDNDIAQRFRLNITDDGDVNFADEPPTWGHPPDPKVQSKSFKRLQRHLQEHEDDDLPPPPPEAFDQLEDSNEKHNMQSRSFKVLQDAVEHGEAPGSVFDRQKAGRSKPSSQAMPKMYRPSPPQIKPVASMPVAPPAPVVARPGQPQPVALPGMVQFQQPSGPPQRSPSQKLPSTASPAAVSPTSTGPPKQPEWKRSPTKPPQTQPVEETRTPFCDACGEEVFGPFVSAIGKAWHPEHFVCDGCGESLQNQGFIEEGGKLYCEKDYNKYFAPHCDTCKQPISGPKSLHACPPAVPPPSSAMLKAIRESSMKGKSAEEAAAKTKTRRLNNALTLKKEAQINHLNLPNNVHSSYMTPVYGVNYPQRAVENDINSNWAQASSISNITNTGAALEQHGEPGMGSLKDKVVALKEALRVATEREANAKEGIPAARKRFQEAKILLSKMERKRFIAEDKVEKLEEKIHHQEGRLQNKYRTMSENWHVNHQFKQKKSEELRNWKNIEYEITELKAAREASMERVREASRRLVIVQSAIQNADDRCRELNARRRTLQDMLEMYNKRIRDLRNKSHEKSVVTKKKATRKDMLQDYTSERKERFKRAERRLLPLKIYINQLHDSIEDGHKELRHAQLLLANCKQRIRKRSYEYYPYTN